VTDAGRLRVVRGDATPEEVAAIVAAVSALVAERGSARSSDTDVAADEMSPWVRASRLVARRRGMTRGSWRLTGRIGRRSRA